MMTIQELQTAIAKGRKKYKNNPVRWIYEMLGTTLWSKQQAVVESVFFNRKTAVRSCHGAGKTFVAACIVLAFLFLRGPCKIITTAPTYYQVVDLLWSEIRQLYIAHLQEEWGYPWEVLISKLELRPDWFAKGLSPKETVNFQGYHQRYILVVGDESPGIRTEIIEGTETLESAGEVHVLHIGNPVIAKGHFWAYFRDPEYNCIHIPASSTPNFTGEKVPRAVAQKLVSRKWVKDWETKYGKDHPYYIAKVLANFPPFSEYQLTSLLLCEQAVARWHELEDGPEGEDVIGIDVAWYGDDMSVLTRRSGLKIVDIRTCSKLDPVEVAVVAAHMYEEKKFKIANVDLVGIGAGTVGELKRLLIPCAGVNAANVAYQYDEYCNRRTELWFDGRDFLVEGGILNHMDLLADLTTPEYGYKLHRGKSKYVIEPKDSMKKKLGRSCDHGDSYNLSVTDERGVHVYAESTSRSVESVLQKMGVYQEQAVTVETVMTRRPQKKISDDALIAGKV